MLAIQTKNTGAALIAQAIRAVAGHFLYCVPGSPITPIVESLGYGFVDLEEADMVRRLIGINARGIPVFAVMKHSGFLAVQELLAALANYELRAPFIFVVGDEAGASSQTGNDTRYLCDTSRISLVEPSANKIFESMQFCLDVSTKLRKPAIFRVVSSLVDSSDLISSSHSCTNHQPYQKTCYISKSTDYFASEGFTISRIVNCQLIEEDFISLAKSLNTHTHHSTNNQLIVASGNIADRVYRIIQACHLDFDVLEINTVSLLPETKIVDAFNHYEDILVLESWEPYLEQKIRCLTQRYGLKASIYGRQKVCGIALIDAVGELEDSSIVQILHLFKSKDGSNTSFAQPLKDYPFSTTPGQEQYLVVYEAICRTASQFGLKPCLSVSTGRTRYAVMATEWESSVKFMGPMGSEVEQLLGYLAVEDNKDLCPGVVLGDYTFRHSAWKGVTSLNHHRVKSGEKVFTVILENGGSKTTGGQQCEHPETIGESLVENWRQRFLGKVSILDDLDSTLATVINPASLKDILIISLEN
jgi:TPP-dependent indolepyruvate ferredoxin oxidoreductase alpha subunit